MNHSNSDDGRRFFTTSEVARYCAVTNDGVLKWIKSGKLRAFSTPGGHYRVSAEDFRSFLENYDIPIDENFFRGNQRQRAAAALELALREPTQPLFEVRAPGKLQVERLMAWNS